MAVRVPYTSTIDRILIVPRLIASALIFGLVAWGIIAAFEFFHIPEKWNISGFLNIVLFLLLVLISGIISAFIYSKTVGKFLFSLSAFLYIRLKLKTKMSWRDSNSVAFLFIPNETGKWYPMLDALKIEQENRESYIKEFAKKVLETELQQSNKKETSQ